MVNIGFVDVLRVFSISTLAFLCSYSLSVWLMQIMESTVATMVTSSAICPLPQLLNQIASRLA